MKLKYVFPYFIYFILKTALRLSPEKGRYYLGLGFSKLAYSLSGKRREIARKNLEKAMGDKLSDAEIKELVKEVYKNLGLTLVEFMHLKNLNKSRFMSYINFENEKALKEAFDQGNGVIIYGAHIGNWEWMAAAIARAGYPLVGIAKGQRMLDQEINRIRESSGMKIVKTGTLMREAFRTLKQGQCLFILGDQDAREKGWMIEFFGRPTSTYNGAVKLASRTGAAIIPAHMIREDWNQHRLIFGNPFKIGRDASEAEQKMLLQQLSDQSEKMIRKYPGQWLWTYRRWKSYS